MNVSNVVLIGMPGCGKSTVGVLLAKRLGLGFTDTDLIIQQEVGRTLQAIVDGEGYEALRRIEGQVLQSLKLQVQVISTGGSAVYSDAAMNHLASDGVVVFLDIPLAEVRRRIGDSRLRGISKHPDQSIDDLFRERFELYRRYAQLRVSADLQTADQVCEAVVKKLTNHNFIASDQ